MCDDVYGTYPNDPQAGSLTAAYLIATWLLEQMANRGNGIYQEFKDDIGVANVSLGALDYSSLASKNVMKTLFVRSMSADPSDNDVLTSTAFVDADGDGLPDTLDNAFNARRATGMNYITSNFAKDSDGDCFDDNFEVMHYDDGFRPDVKDGRGCDPMSPLTLGCTCRDTDGDGLSQFAEAYLHTRETLVDSDGDGVPDGEEVRYGLDPLTPAQRWASTPTATACPTPPSSAPTRTRRAATSPFVAKNGYEYEKITPTDETNGSVCYDFCRQQPAARLSPLNSQAGVRHRLQPLQGLLRRSARERRRLRDYRVWRTACAWAQYAPADREGPSRPRPHLRRTATSRRRRPWWATRCSTRRCASGRLHEDGRSGAVARHDRGAVVGGVHRYVPLRRAQRRADCRPTATVSHRGPVLRPVAGGGRADPIKILLAMDASQSMNVTDPNGTRVTAMLDLFNNLPNDNEICVSAGAPLRRQHLGVAHRRLGRARFAPEFPPAQPGCPQNRRRLDIAHAPADVHRGRATAPTTNRDSTDFRQTAGRHLRAHHQGHRRDAADAGRRHQGPYSGHLSL